MEPLRVNDPNMDEGNGKWYKVRSIEVKKNPPLEYWYRTFLDSVYDKIKMLQKAHPSSTSTQKIDAIKRWASEQAWPHSIYVQCKACLDQRIFSLQRGDVR